MERRVVINPTWFAGAILLFWFFVCLFAWMDDNLDSLDRLFRFPQTTQNSDQPLWPDLGWPLG